MSEESKIILPAKKKLPREQELYIEVDRLRKESYAQSSVIQETAKRKRMEMVNDTTTRVAALHKDRDQKVALLRQTRDTAKQVQQKEYERALRELKGKHESVMKGLDRQYDEDVAAVRETCTNACIPIEQEYQRREKEIKAEAEEAMHILTVKTEEQLNPLAAELAAYEARVKAAQKRLDEKKAAAGG